MNAGSYFCFTLAEDDAGTSAKIEGYRVLKTGDIGLFVRGFGKSHFA